MYRVVHRFRDSEENFREYFPGDEWSMKGKSEAILKRLLGANQYGIAFVERTRSAEEYDQTLQALDGFTCAELKALAADMGLSVPDDTAKEELLSLVLEAQE